MHHRATFRIVNFVILTVKLDILYPYYVKSLYLVLEQVKQND